MSRRAFVRRLVAAGMGFGAAVSYAHLLSPDRAAGADRGFAADGYDPPRLLSLEMLPDDLDRVIRRRRVKVRGTASHPASFEIFLHLYRSPRRTQWPKAEIGGAVITFTAANTPQTFAVPIREGSPVYALNAQKRNAKIGASPATPIIYRR